MGKYQPGDIVKIDGRDSEIRSWPDNDSGPFVATYTDAAGGVTFMNLHTGVNSIGEPVHENVDVTPVKKGNGKATELPEPGPDSDDVEPVVEGLE